MSIRKRVTVTFDIDTDPMPGNFHDPEDFLKPPYFLPRLWDQYNGEMVSSKIGDATQAWSMWRHRCAPQDAATARQRLRSFGAEVSNHTEGKSDGMWMSFLFRADESIIDRVIDAGDMGDISCVDTKNRYRSVPMYNSSFMEELKRLCAARERAFTVVFIDMDNFEQHCKELGQSVINPLFRSLKDKIQEALRPTDIVSHYKDPEMCDEFLVLLRGVDWGRAQLEVDSILEVIPTLSSDRLFTASAGYIVVDPKTCVASSDPFYIHELADDIIKTVRIEEDNAKKEGKNCCSGGVYSLVNT